MKDVCDLEEKQKQVMKSRNNQKLMNGRQRVREMVATQNKTVISIQAELNTQFGLVKDKLESCYQTDDVQFKEGSCRQQTGVKR